MYKHTQIHRHIERSIKIKKVFKCSLFLKPLHKHIFVWSATRFQKFTEWISAANAFDISTCSKKQTENTAVLQATWVSCFWAGVPCEGALVCYQPRYTPPHPPKAAGFSLSPVMLSGQIHMHLDVRGWMRRFHKDRQLVCIFRLI